MNDKKTERVSKDEAAYGLEEEAEASDRLALIDFKGKAIGGFRGLNGTQGRIIR